MDVNAHYDRLFSEIERCYGSFDDETLTGLIGFTGGGPVSLAKNDKQNLYVTVELSLNSDQTKSSDGLKFELLSVGDFDADSCQKLFTALGTLSLNAKLGHGHTIDVSGVLGGQGPSQVRLELFCKERMGLLRKYGVYRVRPA
ncbi:MAG: hypothetical protein COB25_007365 [Oceanospirillales bacterium]|nr:hypothetical protein [Oceanospirillales bacterium]